MHRRPFCVPGRRRPLSSGVCSSLTTLARPEPCESETHRGSNAAKAKSWLGQSQSSSALETLSLTLPFFSSYPLLPANFLISFLRELYLFFGLDFCVQLYDVMPACVYACRFIHSAFSLPLQGNSIKPYSHLKGKTHFVLKDCVRDNSVMLPMRLKV